MVVVVVVGAGAGVVVVVVVGAGAGVVVVVLENQSDPSSGAARAACRQKSAKRASLIIVYSFVLDRI